MPALERVVQQDLSKGSNVVTNPYIIGKQQSILLTNLLLDEHGSVRGRDGTLIQTSSPDVAPNIRAIIKLFNFIRQDGTKYPLAMVLGVATNNQLYNRGGSPWTLIGTFNQKEPLPDILAFTNLAIICDGYETPQSYDGTTLTALTAGVGQTVPGGAKHQTLHQGFYWIWNTALTSGSLDGPSALRSSSLNNPNDWPNANQVFIDKDDGDFGQGMGQFTIAETGISPTTSQILFKQFSAYQMTGVFGSTSPVFAIQRIKSDMGCTAARTIRFAPGFGLIRLTHRGFALFDGVDDRLISEEIHNLIFGGGGFTGLDFTNIFRSYATVIPDPPMYVCFCPTSGGSLTIAFAYDLVRRAWTVHQFPNPVSTVQTIQDPNTVPVTLTGDFSGGKVRRIFGGDITDDGADIVWEVLCRPGMGSSPQQNTYFRRMIVKVTNVIVGKTITNVVMVGPTIPLGPLTILNGTAAVGGAATSVTVVDSRLTLPYQLSFTTNWATDMAWVVKNNGSFTASFVTAAPGGGGSIDWKAQNNPTRSPSGVSKTYMYPISVGPAAGIAAGYGVQPYGISPYGGVGVVAALAPELDITFDLHRIGPNARALISGIGPVTVRGIEWHLKSKPVSRASIYA